MKIGVVEIGHFAEGLTGKMFRAFLGVLFLGVALAQLQDQTRVSGAHGSEIVEAVVNTIRKSCVFPDDKLFLRRLAYVETHDGNDPKTYRSGYNGGIWQVSGAI